MRWATVAVENNGTQEFITNHIGEMNIPVLPFTTGHNKANVEIGIPWLAAMLRNRRLIFPTGTHEAKAYVDTLMNECLNYGAGHTGDVLMATWFAVNLIRLVNPVGSSFPLPSPENLTTGIDVGYQGGELPMLDETNSQSEFGVLENDFLPGDGLASDSLPLFGEF